MKKKTLFSLGLVAAFAAGLFSFHPLARAVESFGTTTCTSQQPCIGGINNGVGAGAIAYSAKNTGVVGQTKAASNASSFGVWGKDASTSGNKNAGVFGTSARGAGVIGQTQRGLGVNGVLKGPLPASPPFSPAAVEALDTTGNGGIAFIGVSNNNNAVYGEADSSSNSISSFVANAPNGADLFYGAGTGGSQVAIDTNGNFLTTGEVFTGGSCNQGCDRRRHVKSAAVTAAAPTIEDTGEARLAFGTAYVALDPRFANGIDLRQNYLVFVTPEGDTRGLFVSRRTASGFQVREIEGGRSSIEFAYRIVAHPLGASTERMPFVVTGSPSRARVAPETLEP